MTDEAVQVFIPLEIRKRNGRRRIVTTHTGLDAEENRQQPQVLRAIGRAWSWRKKIESSEFSTIHDLAKVEGVTDRYISRMMRLAYLSPATLEQLVVMRLAPQISITDLINKSYLPLPDQLPAIFKC